MGERIAARVAARVALGEWDRQRIARAMTRRFYDAVLGRGDNSVDVLLADLEGLSTEVRVAVSDAVALGVQAIDGESP